MPRDYETSEEKPKNDTLTFQDLIKFAAEKQAQREKEQLHTYKLIFVCLAVPAMLWEAWVFQHLWFWFVQPVFKIAVPGIPQMMGLLLLLATLKPNREIDLPYLKKAVWSIFANPFWFFVIGWLISRFI